MFKLVAVHKRVAITVQYSLITTVSPQNISEFEMFRSVAVRIRAANTGQYLLVTTVSLSWGPGACISWDVFDFEGFQTVFSDFHKK